MSQSSPFSSIGGVRGYSVGDLDGNAVEEHLPNRESGEVVAVAAMIGNMFCGIGDMLGVGGATIITVRANSGSWVVAYQEGHSISVELDSSSAIPNIESEVQRGSWVPKGEWELSDTEIQYVPTSSDEPSADSASPQGMAKGSYAAELPDAEPAAELPKAAPAAEAPTPNVPKPPSPRRSGEHLKQPIPSMAPRLASANARGLRRALIQGDLKSAWAIAEHVKESPPSNSDPCGAGESAKVIGPLIMGIASVLSGDNRGALEELGPISQKTDLGPSLNWMALVWSARANIATVEGLDRALSLAEAAGRLSKQIDVEARSVSARLVAEVCLYRGHLEHAERFIETARRLSESLADRDASAEILLLQARISLALGKREQAITAAERARIYRQHWVAPVMFLCRCAFEASDLERVRGLVTTLSAGEGLPAEALRIPRLLDAAAELGMPPKTAAELLELDEAPPSSACIARLEELAGAFPGLETIQDTLGWKLLKAGRCERASVVFDRLSQRKDLPEEVLSSVLLALGYLAAIRGQHSSAGAKVRATVEAAPKHLQSARPPARSSTRMRAANPIEIAALEPPPALLVAASAKASAEGASRLGRNRPVFTGRLSHFGLRDLLEFLRAGRRTGTLLCSSVEGVGAVHFRDGAITSAAAPGTRSLREMLIADGKLTSAAAEKAGALQRTAASPVPIGNILINEGWVTAYDIEACLQAQMKSAISELLHWSDGQFAFDPDAGESQNVPRFEVALDPQAVLMGIYSTMNDGMSEPSRKLP
jgi:hypothetical protein